MAKAKTKVSRLDAETLKEIARVVIETLREEEESKAVEVHDSRLHSVKKLLRDYRSLAEYSDSAIYDATQADDDIELQDLLELMENKYEISVDAVKAGVVRTRILMDHTKMMLQRYEVRCAKSKKPEMQRRFRVLDALYLSAAPMTAQEIADMENVELRTVYRDIDSAADDLTPMIFGADSLKVVNTKK